MLVDGMASKSSMHMLTNVSPMETTFSRSARRKSCRRNSPITAGLVTPSLLEDTTTAQDNYLIVGDANLDYLYFQGIIQYKDWSFNPPASFLPPSHRYSSC